MQKLKYSGQLGAAIIVLTLFAGCSRQAREARHSAKADRYFEAGQYDAAEIEYLNAARINPKDPHVIGRLAIIYFDEGLLQKSYALLTAAKQLAPDNLEVRVDLGLYLLELGKMDAARDEALYVLEHDPNSENGPLLLAESATQVRDMDAVQQRLEQLPVSARNGAPVLAALANLQLRQKRYAAAEALFQQSLQADSRYANACTGLAALYWEQKDLAKAGDFFTKAADLSSVRSAKRLQLAQFKDRTGDAVGARKILEDVIQKAPDFLPPKMQLAEMDEQARKFDEAEASVESVLSKDPLYPDAMVLSGRLKLAKNEPAKAIPIFEKARSFFPRNPALDYELAQAYLAAGAEDKAAAALNSALTLAPDFAEAAISLAQIEIRENSLPAAIISLRQIVQRRPDFVPARLLLATAYEGLGNFDDALAIYRQMEAAAPNLPRPATLVGSVLAQQNKLAEARHEFERALSEAPDDPTALEQLIRLDLAEKNYSDARRLLEAKIEKTPSQADNHLLLARVSLAQGDMKQGEAELKRTIELKADSSDAYFLLAEVYYSTKEDKQAVADLEKVVADNPKDTRSLMLMGSIQMQEKAYEAARTTFETLLAVDPKYGDALNNLAYLYSEIFNDLDKGFAMAQQARNVLPDNPYVADTLGWILYKRHQYTWALTLLRDAAAGISGEPEIEFHLGMNEYMLGQEDAARTSLQHALQAGADFPEIERGRARFAILSIDVTTAGDSERKLLEQNAVQHPDDPIVLARLAEIYERTGDLKQAIETYKAALKINSDDLTVLTRLSRLQAANGENSAAFDLAKTAHNLAPNDSEVSHLLGQLAYRVGDYAWSASLLTEIAAKEPQNADVLFDLGEANYSLGKTDAAAGNIQGALDANGNFSRAALARRFLELVQAQTDNARLAADLADAEKVLQSEPNDVPALMVKGANLARSGDSVGAVQTFETVLRVDPFFSPADRQLVELYAAQPNADKRASEVATKALEAFPDDPAIAKYCGIIAYRSKEYKRSENLLQESANRLTDDGEVLFFLGMAQHSLNEKVSKESLEHALKLKLPPELEAEATRALAGSNSPK